mmetsp:Transcript_36437/g.102719  ORF Transcript_36437/g.102719 Transcript_36437/m.102719 type:complete len:262 (+) Transcript_36437:201-986(+)
MIWAKESKLSSRAPAYCAKRPSTASSHSRRSRLIHLGGGPSAASAPSSAGVMSNSQYSLVSTALKPSRAHFTSKSPKLYALPSSGSTLLPWKTGFAGLLSSSSAASLGWLAQGSPAASAPAAGSPPTSFWPTGAYALTVIFFLPSSDLSRRAMARSLSSAFTKTTFPMPLDFIESLSLRMSAKMISPTPSKCACSSSEVVSLARPVTRIPFRVILVSRWGCAGAASLEAEAAVVLLHWSEFCCSGWKGGLARSGWNASSRS